MILDFDNMPYETLPNFKGGELAYHAKRYGDDNIKIMRGHLEPGASIGLHTHDDSCEAIYILSGVGIATIDGTDERLRPGMCHYCPKGATHTLRNPGPGALDFVAIVPTVKD